MAFERFNKLIPLIRSSSGSYANGLWIPAAGVEETLKGSVQQPTPSDLKTLPEARRLDDSVVVFTRDLITEGDKLSLKGATYEVLKVSTWDNGVLPHRRAIAVKMQKEGSL